MRKTMSLHCRDKMGVMSLFALNLKRKNHLLPRFQNAPLVAKR